MKNVILGATFGTIDPFVIRNSVRNVGFLRTIMGGGPLENSMDIQDGSIRHDPLI
jgi:hypothetical protein